MRIAVIGAGAIGCLFGIRLHRSGHQVLLIHHRRRVVDSVRRTGLTLIERSEKILLYRIQVKQFLSVRDNPDLVLLTVKAYDTESAAIHLARVLSHKTTVLSLQNGLGNIETLSRHLPRHEIIAGSTTEPALLTRPGVVKHTGSGITWLGEYRRKSSKPANLIKRIFRGAGFKTELRANIERVIWSKAIVNSAINPVSALAGVSNGEILRIPHLKDAALKLLSEGAAVARAYGILPSPSPIGLFSRITEATRTNRSSMLRDIESRRMTEIRELNGLIASYGKSSGILVPCNSFITDLVLGLEASRAKLRPAQALAHA